MYLQVSHSKIATGIKWKNSYVDMHRHKCGIKVSFWYNDCGTPQSPSQHRECKIHRCLCFRRSVRWSDCVKRLTACRPTECAAEPAGLMCAYVYLHTIHIFGHAPICAIVLHIQLFAFSFHEICANTSMAGYTNTIRNTPMDGAVTFDGAG